MGKKVDPRSFRVGPHLAWESRWFNKKKEYIANLLSDYKLRQYLFKSLQGANLEKVEIERSVSQIKLILKVGRPGVVIGRGGANIQNLNQELAKITKDKVTIDVETVKNPDTSATLIASNIARRIEGRFPYNRIMRTDADKAMEKGAKGVRIKCAGVLGGPSSIARSVVVSRGAVPGQTIRANIDYAKDTAFTAYGTIGIKVWVYKGDVKV
ncbi:30S ribosomal protein S3 [candidate division WWE3 bacterium CG08_land_8_20_14_0_20_43_13]|uniref:Small ribosomal subunit protein uS3 n=1 Tax=candidate division WWE3 bacterium CG08_land_8_20_14_0_20_43_13 TaxID=1975087 RepID=A0A2H0X774_UNCKA|nr:MAG: 30S ribosomal protein S3 [candidate division WWE3 bacterium CG08_land_8_20_14_0_20_43_13]